MKTKCFFEEISTEEILSINGGGLTSWTFDYIVGNVAAKGYYQRSKGSLSEETLRKVTNRLINNGYVVRVFTDTRGKQHISVTKANN